MGIDYKPKQELNPMGRSDFDKMSLQDQSRFCLKGGRVYEDRPEQLKKPDRGRVVSSSGQSMGRDEFDALTPKDQAAFIIGTN